MCGRVLCSVLMGYIPANISSEFWTRGRLFFKTDAQSQADYTARGMGPFTYEMKGKVMTMSYHEVPPNVLEQPQELAGWARKAIAIAAAARKPARIAKRNSAANFRIRYPG